MTMTSNKPYLIRALHEWIVDNELTPYLLVNVEYPGVQIPQDYVTTNRIVLDVSPSACRGLHIANDRIVFTTRFSGQSVQIVVTPESVLAIYAKENGRGMEFAEELYVPPASLASSKKETQVPKKERKKPSLTLVKKDD